MEDFDKITTNWEECGVIYIFFFNRPLGCTCRLSLYDDENVGIISDLYVDEKNRGRGLGKELIKSCEYEILKFCRDYAKLYVDKNKQSTGFLLQYYESIGYDIFESDIDRYALIKKIA